MQSHGIGRAVSRLSLGPWALKPYGAHLPTKQIFYSAQPNYHKI